MFASNYICSSNLFRYTGGISVVFVSVIRNECIIVLATTGFSVSTNLKIKGGFCMSVILRRMLALILVFMLAPGGAALAYSTEMVTGVDFLDFGQQAYQYLVYINT